MLVLVNLTVRLLHDFAMLGAVSIQIFLGSLKKGDGYDNFSWEAGCMYIPVALGRIAGV